MTSTIRGVSFSFKVSYGTNKEYHMPNGTTENAGEHQKCVFPNGCSCMEAMR